MKAKKNKAASKLKSLKENETSLVEARDLLDADIPFDEAQTETNAVERSETSLSVVRRSTSSSEREPNPLASSDSADDGTMVLTDEESDLSNATDVTHNRARHEITYREITAGRKSPKETEKVSYGDVYENDTVVAGGSRSSATVDGLLKKSEHLRIAQEKINELENEVEDLRKQNHELSNDAESIANLNESYSAQIENLRMELTHVRTTLSEEAKILRHSMYEKERIIAELKQGNSDLKSKVENNFKSIRKRERDLEYRLELAKVDEAALLKSKDKMILELRRELEKKDQEKSAFERKNKEHFQKIQEQQQTVRTVVRALRIALTRLEGDFGVDFEVLKKAE